MGEHQCFLILASVSIENCRIRAQGERQDWMEAVYAFMLQRHEDSSSTLLLSSLLPFSLPHSEPILGSDDCLYLALRKRCLIVTRYN